VTSKAEVLADDDRTLETVQRSDAAVVLVNPSDGAAAVAVEEDRRQATRVSCSASRYVVHMVEVTLESGERRPASAWRRQRSSLR
jgi:acyl CoA:acetate/3-ketoacid CoA transferase alpha subunit